MPFLRSEPNSEKYDKILRILRNRGVSMRADSLESEVAKIFENPKLAISKLIGDGYIFEDFANYSLTTDGEHFLALGGYSGKTQSETEKNNREKSLSESTTKLNEITAEMNSELLKGIEFNRNISIITLIVAIVTLISSCWNSNVKTDDSELQKQSQQQYKK